jgi:cytochrome b pre-mRNA-processing protein 3
LYACWGVPDTAEGRFEMIALHVVVVLHRLGHAGDPGRRLARALTEAFAADIDDNLREMTVGDLAVPRHVKRAVAALHGWHASYQVVADADDDGPLAAALEARVARASASGGLDARRFCAYIRCAGHHLDLLPSAEVLAGRIAWPQIDTAGHDAQAIGG